MIADAVHAASSRRMRKSSAASRGGGALFVPPSAPTARVLARCAAVVVAILIVEQLNAVFLRSQDDAAATGWSSLRCYTRSCNQLQSWVASVQQPAPPHVVQPSLSPPLLPAALPAVAPHAYLPPPAPEAAPSPPPAPIMMPIAPLPPPVPHMDALREPLSPIAALEHMLREREGDDNTPPPLQPLHAPEEPDIAAHLTRLRAGALSSQENAAKRRFEREAMLGPLQSPSPAPIPWGVTASLNELLPPLQRYLRERAAKSPHSSSTRVRVATQPGARSDTDFLQRSQFFYDCRSKGAAYGTLGAGVTPPRTLRDRATLRQHAVDVFIATEEYRQGEYSTWANYSGPWLENYFVDTFASPVLELHVLTADALRVPARAYVVVSEEAITSNDVRAMLPEEWKAALASTPLGQVSATLLPYDIELFWPLTPLLVRWTDLQVNGLFSASVAARMISKLFPILREDVPYLAVVQLADGVYLKNSILMKNINMNLLVISAGGSGSVPVPLLTQPRHPAPDPKPIAQRSHHISFVGSHRDGQRERALQALSVAALHNPTLRVLVEGHTGADEWMRISHDSMFIFAPRGTGPTSFRLYEALHMGIVPIYVYDDMWLPYRAYDASLEPPTYTDPWTDIAHVVRLADLPDWLESQLPRFLADTSRYSAMVSRMLEMRDAYFTFDGVVRHIYQFIATPEASELRCVPRTL